MKRKLLPVSVLIIATLGLVIYGCSKDDEPDDPQNSPPSINLFTSSPNISSGNGLEAGEQVTITAYAIDADKDNLSYSWNADGGSFVGETNSSTITWESPILSSNKSFTITATVSDGNATSSKDFSVFVYGAYFVSLEGYTYYAGTTLPVSGVRISIYDSITTTNDDGYYEINGIPYMDQILTATKEGFDDIFINFEVGSWPDEFIMEMTSGQYTHKLFGEIRNQIGDPIRGVIVVALNPDGTESDLTTTSNSLGAGYYQIPNVPQGERTIRFRKVTCEPVEVNVLIANSNYELNVELQESGIACPEEPTVNYEGQIYNTVLIGNQCWLKENLNVGQMIVGDDEMENNEIIEKYCYNDDPSNCSTYGALYQWDEMMQYTTMQGTRGICPPNWHIPTDEEWKILEGSVDSKNPIGDPDWDDDGLRGYDAGERLKTYSGWSYNGNGTDLFGYSIMPGGHRDNDGYFSSLGEYGTFCSSTESNRTSTWSRYVRCFNSGVIRYDINKDYGFAVRCVRD
jgi:uncharacterized protein (TIGR02145 family)